MSPSHTRVNQSSTQPTVRKAGTYRLVLDVDSHNVATVCLVYRNDPAQRADLLVTRVRAATTAQALSEARRNVRNARKAGGL